MTTTSTRPQIAMATLALVLLAIAGCSKSATDTSDDSSAPQQKAPAIAGTHARTDDGHYDSTGGTTIKLADGGSKVTGDGATVKGDVVTISKKGKYVLSGTLSDGQVKVNSPLDGQVKLVLKGVDIASATSSPLDIAASDETVVILAAGSENTLSDGTGSAADDAQPTAPTATLYSEADLTIAGSGSLTVDGVSNDGIVSKDGLVILGGDVTVKALDDGIGGKDYLVVEDGTLDVTAGGDALKSNGDTVGKLGWIRVDGGKSTLAATKNAVSAEGHVDVTDGTVQVTKADDGVKSKVITMSGGTVDVAALNDGIKATSGAATVPGAAKTVEAGVKLTVSGGTVSIDAGGDGIQSNGTADITGGVVTIGKSGKNAIDVIGTAKTPGRATVTLPTSGKVELKDSTGNSVASFTASKPGLREVMATGIKAGATYKVSVDGKDAGTATATAAGKPGA